MNNPRQIFGTNYGSNRPVSPRQRALFARGHLGRGEVTVPESTAVGPGHEIVSALPRFVVDFNGQRPAGVTINVRPAVGGETSLPAAA
ncbi:MAG TPA: hypothetical protein VMB21_10280 [Candidatus Limnocylindria bacterium]|jgi:hypothetical protein|nr:hypothetical protein [Candidatus Limnocylindria bacterium]